MVVQAKRKLVVSPRLNNTNAQNGALQLAVRSGVRVVKMATFKLLNKPSTSSGSAKTPATYRMVNCPLGSRNPPLTVSRIGQIKKMAMAAKMQAKRTYE